MHLIGIEGLLNFLSFLGSITLTHFPLLQSQNLAVPLSRKGEGAARFKQGLGFSSAPDGDPPPPSRGSALPSSSSFLSNFVRASSPAQSSKLEKEAQLQSVQNKLKKKSENNESFSARDSDRSNRGREATSSHRRRSRSRERDRGRDGDRHSRRRSRSRSRSRERYRERHRSRSRSRSRSPRKEVRSDRRSRSRSLAPCWERRRSEKSRREDVGRDRAGKAKNEAVDYARFIEGYDKMTQAGRVKARMKFQLSDTAKKDTTKGSSGWERFEFDQDAPLDDEEVEAAEDDTGIVKNMGQSFRFTAVEAKREERVKVAHDEAMFGAPVARPASDDSDSEPVLEDKKETSKPNLSTSLLSEKVLAKQQGSWRDRARKP